MSDTDKPPLMFPWINSPYVRQLEAWLWKHPKTAISLTLVSAGLISSPAWFSDFWSLFSNEAPVPKIWNWLSGLPAINFSWYWLPVGLGSVMLMVITSLLLLGRKRLEAEVASARIKPESAAPAQPQEAQCHYDPVHRIADHQAKNIRDFVTVSRVGVWEHKLNEPVPTIKWGLMIRNRSILPIGLVEVRNNLFFENTELAERRFEIHNEVEHLEHWRRGTVVFEQRLSGVEAQHIRNTPDGKFRFNRLIIKVGNPNSCPIIEPQELAIGDDLEATLNELTYKETEGMVSLRKERDYLQSRLKTLDGLGLSFEIDEKQSQVNTTGGGTAGRRISASILLRCMKTAEHPMAIRDFHCALILKQGDSQQAVVPRESALVVMAHPDMTTVDFSNGWTINEPLTGYRWFKFYLDITEQQLQMLSRDYFMRVTMTAIGQHSVSVDFDVNNWNDARSSNSYIMVRE